MCTSVVHTQKCRYFAIYMCICTTKTQFIPARCVCKKFENIVIPVGGMI